MANPMGQAAVQDPDQPVPKRPQRQVIELPGGHCPYLSRPALLAEALITTTSR